MKSSPIIHEYPLDPRVSAFSTTRHGGCSTGNYASFNINHYCGDDETCIARNREQLCQCLGIRNSRLFLPHQVHHTDAIAITKTTLELSSDVVLQALLENKDAITTNVPGCCIGVSTADCIPILLYDTDNHAAAAIHAGWRGTLNRIVCETIAHMKSYYNTNPRYLKAVIGPGISLESFEVGDEVYDAFAKAGFPMEQMARRFPSMHPDDTAAEKWHIDLPLCNHQQLISAGVPPSQIHSSGICTYRQSDDFFSARRLGIRSGRIFTGIMLKQPR